MRLITPASARLIPWKNGLGSTLEVATDADAPGGEWTWRLSLADVPARAPFSIFPGIDRCIACLAGPGLALERAGTRVLVPSVGEGLVFGGEESVVGEPLGPGVRDANLMVRRDRWRGRMTLIRDQGIALDATVVLVHVPTGFPALRAAGLEGACEVPPGHTLVASGPVVLTPAPGGAAVVCHLGPPLTDDGI